MALKITLTRSDPLQMAVDYVVVGVPEGTARKSAVLRSLKKAVGPLVSKLLNRHEFTGKRDQVVVVPTAGALKAAHVAVVGLGAAATLSSSGIRRMAAVAARRAGAARATSMALALPCDASGAPLEGAGRAAAEGVVLGAYRFEPYKTEAHRTKHPLAKVALVIGDKVAPAVRDDVALGQRVGEAVCLARDLIN
jgi:leucyl aminopeptidase